MEAQGLDVYFWLDIFVVLNCGLLLWRYGRISHSHPATIYLFFHVFTFTLRLLGIWQGAPTIFSLWGPKFSPVTPDEIARAMILADVVLIVMTITWIFVARKWGKRLRARRLRQESNATSSELPLRPADLSVRNIWRVVAIALPIGVVSFFMLSRIPGAGSQVAANAFIGGDGPSTLISMPQAWGGLCLLALIYWYGFRWQLVLPMSFYLFVIALQGFSRYRLVIAVILLLQIYLDRSKLRWPKLPLVIALLGLGIIFFPLKSIGRMVQQGRPISEVFSSAQTNIAETISGDEQGDQTFLDQFASTLTLIDESGKRYYGSTYLPLVTVAIPRSMWSDKPDLNQYQKDISTFDRPMGKMGMISTMIGEFYANFGLLGIVVMPALVAYFWSQFYFRAYQSPYYSVVRFSYLVLACNSIQVFRDGLISIFIFIVINMLPLTAIIVLHLPPFTRRKRKKKRLPRHNLPLLPNQVRQVNGESRAISLEKGPY